MASIGGLQGSIMGTAQPIQVNPDRTRKTLEAVASSGTAAAKTAQQLLQRLNANPALANDPSFGQLVDQVDVAATVSKHDAGTGLGAKQAQVPAAGLARMQSDESSAKQSSIIQQILNNAQQSQTENKQFVDENVSPFMAWQGLTAGQAQQAEEKSLADQTASRDTATSRMNNAVSQQRSNATAYNYLSGDMYNNYAQQQSALSGQDQSNLSRYMNETSPLMTQLKAQGSDPADVQRQMDSYNQLSGVGSGSLDYQAQQAALSQAAYREAQLSQADYRQYSSDPNDVRNQQQALTNFNNIGKGSLDWQSQAAQAYTDPKDYANQAKALKDVQQEVATGGAKQQESYDLMKSRTGVEQTAQERLLYELNRRQAESQNKSSRDAVMSNLAARGILSGGAQIASMQQAGQQIAQDRQLADMAANAGAVGRAEQYTGMMADQGNQMRNSQQNALGLQGNLSTAMRNASFDEAYKRGIGADNASQANQGTRLAGYTNAGAQSNAIRNANDNVGMFNTDAYNQNSMFNTGQANNMSMFNAGQYNQTQQFNAGQANNVSMFNAGQTNQASANNQSTRLSGMQGAAQQSNSIRSADDSIRMFQDTYAQNEAARVGNLAGQRANTSLNTTNQVGQRNAQTYGDGQTMLNTNYGRDKDTTSLDYGAAKDIYGMDTDVNALARQNGQNLFNRTQQMAGTAMGIAGTRSGQSASDGGRLVSALQLQLGQVDADDAKRILGGY